jgi:uncharacterized protein (TIGR00369 family)
MIPFQAKDVHFERRVRENFAQQTAMTTIGASMESASPGRVEIRLPFSPQFTQQHGYLHAGIVTAAVDSACGFAAMTLIPAGSNILTVEYKVNFMAPARGAHFLATGKVIKAGKTLMVCEGQATSDDGSLIAAMLTTMMVMSPQPV